MRPISLKDVDKSLVRRLHHIYHGYRNDEGVFLIDIGFRHKTNSHSMNDLCVRVHRYHPESEEICYCDKVEQHFYKRGSSSSSQPPRISYQPGFVQPGIGIHTKNGLGTIGAICYEKGNPAAPRLLTCYHVVNNMDLYVPAAKFTSVAHQNGYLNRFSEQLDMAFIQLSTPHTKPRISNEIYGTNDVLLGATTPRLGDILSKVGVTTGYTQAVIDGIGGIYAPGGLGEITGCFRLVPSKEISPSFPEISLPGDSGAVWYNSENLGVGLHLDGEKTSSPNKEFAIAQSLQPLLHLFEFSLTPTPPPSVV